MYDKREIESSSSVNLSEDVNFFSGVESERKYVNSDKTNKDLSRAYNQQMG